MTISMGQVPRRSNLITHPPVTGHNPTGVRSNRSRKTKMLTLPELEAMLRASKESRTQAPTP